MIAQLSHIAPRGRPCVSIVGVRWAGFMARNSGVVVFPHTSTSSKSSPAARTKMRAVRLLTLGFRMWSVMSAMSSSSGSVPCYRSIRILRRSVVRERPPRSSHKRLDGVGQVDLLDVAVAAGDADPVRLEQDVRMREARRRLEPVRGELDQEPQRIGEVDGVHEAAVLHAAVADRALVEPRDRLAERRL